MAEYITPRQQLLKRAAALKSDRSSWDSHWKEIADNIQPRRARFFGLSEANKGDKRNANIINNTPLIAMRVAAAGMMAGITSPARQWFRLGTPDDPDVAMYGEVRNWLAKAENVLNMVFAKSNWYNSLSGGTYPDLLGFGTHAAFFEEDDEDVIRLYPLALGEYTLACNARGVVDTIFREAVFTVRQLVQQFGTDTLLPRTKDLYQRGDLETRIEVTHCVMPNEDYEPGILGIRGKKFVSLWFEKGSPDDLTAGFLRQAGYRRFPVLAPRWALTNSVSDTYGFSPGMEALGDCKELQHLERRKAKLVDKITDPPMVAPEEMRNQRLSLLPGDVTYLPRINSGMKIEPAMVVNPGALSNMNELINSVENRVAKAFYADLWLQIIEDNRTQPATAREIAERHEEKMLQLGPVVERVEDELLDPAIELAFEAVMRRGMLPTPPRELQGRKLNVEYISIMAQAQRLVNISGAERFLSFVMGAAQSKPEALDMLNIDKAVEHMASTYGVPPEYLNNTETVEEIRGAREEKNRQMEQMQALPEIAKAAKTFGETDTGNAEMAARRALGPIASAQGGF